MNVLFITHNDNFQGSSRSLFSLLEGLRAYQVNPFVIVPAESAFTARLAAVGIPFKILPVPWWMTAKKMSLNAKLRTAREINAAARSIQAQIEDWIIDLVYTNSSVSPVGRLAARRAKLPHIWQIREYFDKYFEMQYILPVWWSKHLMQSSQAIICHAKGVLTNYFPDEPENVHLIHNGAASLPEFEERLRKRQNTPATQQFTFLMLSAITPKKGQEQAIRALAVLQEHGINADLVLAGSGRQDYLGYLQGLVTELDLVDLVRFAGFVEDPFHLYYQADCALVCSDYEALSRVGLEAMSCALPVIGKNSGGTPEIIQHGETGYLYDTPVELAARIPNVFYTNKEERLGNQRVKIENFTIEPAHPATGQAVRFLLDLNLPETETTNLRADYSVSFMTEQGNRIFQLHSGHVDHDIELKPGINRIAVQPDYLPLTPGKYYVNLWVGSGHLLYDWIPEAMTFIVEPGTFDPGVLIDNRGYPVVVNANWQSL